MIVIGTPCVECAMAMIYKVKTQMRHFGIWGRKKETLHKNNSVLFVQK